MIDLELLKNGGASALPGALGRALQRFMKDNYLSTREAGERLGIVHTNLTNSRVSSLRGADVLRPLARCEDTEICVLAQALLERHGIPLNEFDFETLGWQLQAGAGLGGFIDKLLHGPLTSDAAHRAATDELLYCFVRGTFFRQLAVVRASGLRCTPLFPIGRLVETAYSFEPGDDPENYDDELGGRRGNGRFLEEDTFDTERIRTDLTAHYLTLAKRENLFLLEAIENAATFRHSDGEFKDDLTAACAAVEAYIRSRGTAW